VLLAGAAGVGPLLWVTAGPAWAFIAPVHIVDRAPGEYAFSPNVATIKKGDKVLWKNDSDAKERHTVTSDPGSFRFECEQMPKGGQCEKRFPVAGSYTYHCEIHPAMVGRVEVEDPSAPTTTTTAPAPTTTAPPTTTTTTAPAPTTTAPPTTTTTTSPRPAAGQPLPPVPSSSAAPPPTRATSSTTTIASTTTTTAAPPTTVTTAPPTLPGEGEVAPPTSAPDAPPTTAGPSVDTGDEIQTAAGPRRNGGQLDLGAVAMVSALVAVGVFATWTLIRVRPGRV
jgi:plastocyanin